MGEREREREKLLRASQCTTTTTTTTTTTVMKRSACSYSSSASALALAALVLVALFSCCIQRVTATRLLIPSSSSSSSSYEDAGADEVINNGLESSSVGTDFDYFVFTMTWPGTFCEDKKCVKDPPFFTIHGLWPNYSDGTWPAFCNSSYPFNEKEIEDLVPRMNQVWPEVLSTHNVDWLWTHEWEKHGTCAAPVLTGEHSYFSKALELYDVLNPTPVLKEQDIVPSNTKLYDLSDVVDAISRLFGATFNLSCQEGGEDLFQIEFCLDKSFQARDCGSKQDRNCKSKVRIPE